MSTAFIYDTVRTPIGRYGGALAGVRADDLAATVVRGLLDRSPQFDESQVDDVVFGDANQAGEDNRNVGRMAALLAGLPTSVPGVTVNRLCASGVEAAIQAARTVETGDAAVVVAGGVESSSRAPWVLLKPEQPFARDHQMLYSSTLGWRMVNPAMPDEWTISLGEATEILAQQHSISRDAQDEFALGSHRKAHEAWELGRFDDEVVAVPGVDLQRDESIRPDTTREGLARLRPVFRDGGTVTAGNSSPLNDGAGAILIGDKAAGKRLGREPMARIASRAAHAVDPQFFGIGPVEAAERALHRAGIGWDELVSVELNEAFAAQALACLKGWPELDPDIVNPNGGAIAIGHPLGCSGIRILGTLVREVSRRCGGYGLIAICIGVGQGLAMVIEA